MKKRVTLLIFAEAVSRALIGFKQSILNNEKSSGENS